MKNDSTLKRIVWVGTGILGVAIAAYGIVVVAVSHKMTTIPEHHLLHAGMAVGAGMLALALATSLPPRSRERSWWSIPAVLAPTAGLFLMWPSEYAYLMGHPMMHVLDHVGIVLCSVLAVFAAQVYLRGLGWLMLILVIGMDVAAAGGFGVSHKSQGTMEISSMNATSPGSETQAPQVLNGPLHVQGKQVAQNLGCTACHTVDGGKGIGPTWKNLAGYSQTLATGSSVIADYQFLREAILHPENLHLEGFPAGVMPTGFRDMLSGPQHADEHDLHAIIWYINTLSDRSTPASQPAVPDGPASE